ncbi:hypothetical protein [Moorena producens]|nr:hypothetical protein [Moorena producens]
MKNPVGGNLREKGSDVVSTGLKKDTWLMLTQMELQILPGK